MSDDKDAEQMELDLGLNDGTFKVDVVSSFHGDDYIYNGSSTITINTDVLDTGDLLTVTIHLQLTLPLKNG